MSLTIHNTQKRSHITVNDNTIEMASWVDGERCASALIVRAGDFYWQVGLDEALAKSLIDNLYLHIENLKQQEYDLIASQMKAAA
jgi:hypothetical protein